MSRDKPELVGFLGYESDKPAKKKSILGRAGDDPRTGLLGLPLRTDEAKERQIVEAREILTSLKSLTGHFTCDRRARRRHGARRPWCR